MKKDMLTLGLAATIASPALAGNILVNSGFETGVMEPWFQKLDLGGPESWNVTRNDTYTGSYAATARGNKMIYQSFDPVAAKRIISVSFALKNVDSSFNAYRFYYSDNSYKEFYADSLNSGWSLWNVTNNLNRAKTLVGFGVFGVNGGTQYRTYLDDLNINAISSNSGDDEIESVPEPATLAVLGLGVALATARRRR